MLCGWCPTGSGSLGRVLRPVGAKPARSASRSVGFAHWSKLQGSTRSPPGRNTLPCAILSAWMAHATAVGRTHAGPRPLVCVPGKPAGPAPSNRSESDGRASCAPHPPAPHFPGWPVVRGGYDMPGGCSRSVRVWCVRRTDRGHIRARGWGARRRGGGQSPWRERKGRGYAWHSVPHTHLDDREYDVACRRASEPAVIGSGRGLLPPAGPPRIGPPPCVRVRCRRCSRACSEPGVNPGVSGVTGLRRAHRSVEPGLACGPRSGGSVNWQGAGQAAGPAHRPRVWVRVGPLLIAGPPSSDALPAAPKPTIPSQTPPTGSRGPPTPR